MLAVPGVTGMRHLSNNLRGTVLPLLLLRVERRASSSLPLHCCSFPPAHFSFFLSICLCGFDSPRALGIRKKKKQGSDKFQPRFDRGSPLLRDSERFRIIASRRMQMKTARSILNIRDLPVYPRDSNCFFFSPSRERNALEIFPAQCVASEFVQSVLFARTERCKAQEGGAKVGSLGAQTCSFPSVERILTRFPDHSKGEVGVTFTENPWCKYLPAAISWKRHGLACLPTELSAQHDRVP